MRKIENIHYLVLLLFVHIAVARANVEILIFGSKPQFHNVVFSIIYVLTWIAFLRKSVLSQNFNKSYVYFAFTFWVTILFASSCILFLPRLVDLLEGLLIVLSFLFISPLVSLNTKLVFFISIIMLCLTIKRLVILVRQNDKM